MGSTRCAIRTLLIVVAWSGLIIAIAIPCCRASSDPVFLRLGVVGHLVLTPFCHQVPERCFVIAEYSMPLCARCFGLLAGCALGTLIVRFWPVRDMQRLRRCFFLAASILLVDCLLNALLHYDLDLVRWFTGIPFGMMSTLLLWQGVSTIGLVASSQGRKEQIPCT